MIESSRNPLFLFFFFFNLINFANKFIAAQNATFICNSDSSLCFSYFCSNDGGNYTANSPYQQNLTSLLYSLPNTTSTNYGFGNSSAGQGPDSVNSIALCRGDIDRDACRRCISDSTVNVTQFCPNQKEALIWYADCMVRYSNRSLSSAIYNRPNAYLWNTHYATDAVQFMAKLINLMDRLTLEAAGGGPLRKFATGSVPGPASDTIYGLMQCIPDLTQSKCHDCLSSATMEIPSLGYNNLMIGGRVRWPSCNLRYEIYNFFTDPPAITLPSPRPPPPSPPSSPPPSPSPSSMSALHPETPIRQEKGKKTNTSLIIGSAVAASAVGIFIIISVFIKIRRRGRGQGNDLPSETEDLSSICLFEGSELHQMDSSDDAGEMNYYNLTTIQDATDNFSSDNKLGEGGFGPVYWGKLDDGKEIAVKRLCKNSRQGLEEFKTEVKLIIKLQHKNLVRLLGCCIKGNEPLLVYEYMPNTSVDAFLFDPTKCKELNWPRRANISIGIAKGLRYLHEDSRLKIIHRDMKASNVLLDNEMNPKISDFGTARIFGVNQIDANTSKIVGTYGYMAPEYAMEGLFSIKSDVYSFGVLLLEMISGKRNNGFYNQEHRQNLLSYAWRLWRDGKGDELIDQNLIDDCPVNEALRWIQLALLCVQEDPKDRPTMSSVVSMLENQSISLAEPREPPLGFGRLLASDQSSTSGASIGASSSYPESTSASCLLR